VNLSLLESVLTGLLLSVASKRLTGKLNPLDATPTKNKGWPNYNV
jgi:hypothetical protein